jgi:hypothetical protein
MGYQNHRISWDFVKVIVEKVWVCEVCFVPVEVDRRGDVLVSGVLGEESSVGFGFMGGGGVVGLWVDDIFGIGRDRLYRLFDLVRFNLFVSLVRLGCEMERMEFISFV